MYQIKHFENLKGVKGFSIQAIEIHLKLYSGYVDNTNKLVEKIDAVEIGTPEFSELNRRISWEFNGMRLHEIYFDSLIKEAKPIDSNSALYKQIEKDFSSFKNWGKNFIATALSRGIGWVILYWDKPEKKLLNVWIEQHDSGHLAGAVPILLIDMFEHAFLIDYGTDKKSYVEKFMNAINWEFVDKRLK